MTRKRILILSALLLLAAVIYMFLRYNTNLIALRYNPKIKVENIKLIMTDEEVTAKLGKPEESVDGFGGYIFSYKTKGITLCFLNDKDTKFYHKVNSITVTNGNYSILGIKVGDSFEKTKQFIRKHGFLESNAGYEGYYWKGPLYIKIDKDESDTVKAIKIGIEDKVASSRVY